MSRQSIINDRAAQIAWKYFHGELSQASNEAVYNIAHDVFHDRKIEITMLLEIAYREGYAKSDLADDMSEVTYKRKKKRIRDMLVRNIDLEKKNESNY